MHRAWTGQGSTCWLASMHMSKMRLRSAESPSNKMPTSSLLKVCDSFANLKWCPKRSCTAKY